MTQVEAKAIEALDPAGLRRQLFDRHNKNAVRPGAVLQVETYNNIKNTKSKSGTLFAGHLMAIRRRGINTTFRLRSEVMRIGVEQVFALYSPTIKAITLLSASGGKKTRRAKLYYLRQSRHDRGAVDAHSYRKTARVVVE